MEENARYVLLGTAGHIDHGKTALVKMLTGCETDTLKEEKERGLTIDLGFAPCELRGDLMACIVDVPGHEKFIRNMVAGASGIDAVLLVVAADDSVMPQTIEHLHIVELLGINRGLVAVTKIDMVDEELRELCVEEVRDFLKGTFLENSPVCPVSSITGEGFEALWLAITDVVDSCPDRPEHGIFRMPVERVFSPPGFGTVITGMPPTGRVEVGEKLELLPQGKIGRLRGLQVYGRNAKAGFAGQCLAMNVADVQHDNVVRGNVLAAPGYLKATRMFEARLRLLPRADRPLKHQAPVRMHTGTSEVIGRVFFLDREQLVAGESAMVQFRSDEDLIVAPGDRYVIRQYSPVVTIGGGRVLRPSARKVKRFKEGSVRELESLEAVIDDGKGFASFHLVRSGPRPARAEDLKVAAFLPRDRLDLALAGLAGEGKAIRLSGTDSWISAEGIEEVAGRIRANLRSFHTAHPLRKGVSAPDLKKELTDDAAVIEEALSRMVAAGEVVKDDGLASLASHRPAMSAAEEALGGRILARLLDAGVSPPEVKALAADLGGEEGAVREILRALVDRGESVELSEDMFAHPEGFGLARSLLVDHLKEHGQIGVVDYRDHLGASRKYVYAWLDHFDKTGVTYRVENLRYLKGEKGSDPF